MCTRTVRRIFLEPKLPTGTRADGTNKLLRLAMDHAELTDGLLQWNDEKIKLDGAAEDVVLELGYRAADHSYEGEAKVGQVRMQLPEWEPLTLGAEARFRLYRGPLEVPRLRVSSGRSWVEASGAVTGMNSPVAQFAYRAVGDLGELARLVRYRELRGGAVQSSGEGTLSLGSGGIRHGGQGAGRRRDLGGPDRAAGENQRRLCLFAGPRALQRLFDLRHGAGRHGDTERWTPQICAVRSRWERLRWK